MRATWGRTTDRRRQDDRGAALVEFAFVFTVLALVAFSAVDLGRAYFTWTQVKNAAREGAAYAERDPWSFAPAGSSCADPNNIRYRSQNENGTSRPELTVESERNGTPYAGCQTPASFVISSGDRITVEVSTPFTPISPLGGLVFGSPTITASAEVVVQ